MEKSENFICRTKFILLKEKNDSLFKGTIDLLFKVLDLYVFNVYTKCIIVSKFCEIYSDLLEKNAGDDILT